jgi:hypothetical protein
MSETERFPPPWTVRNNEDSFWVEDAAGHRFGFVYYRDRPLAGTDSSVRVSKDAARRLATNFARLPDLLKR